MDSGVFFMAPRIVKLMGDGDCPCHGSQFAVDGTALNAPAIRALDEVKTEE
jgi:nitrite reductase/ring-hydroxylating ferredoxin subunit